MMGYSHKIITTTTAIIVGAPVIGVAGALAGSTLPDADIKLGIEHRTLTHYWPVYVVSAVAIKMYDLHSSLTPLQHSGLVFGFWMCLGALMHILEDSLTKGGVPWITPYGSKFSFRLTKTGGVLEKFIMVGMVALLFYVYPPATLGPHVGHLIDGLSNVKALAANIVK